MFSIGCVACCESLRFLLELGVRPRKTSLATSPIRHSETDDSAAAADGSDRVERQLLFSGRHSRDTAISERRPERERERAGLN